MKEPREIEVMARGVCVKNGMLLVCRTNGASNTYLPGGHIEFNEPAKAALEREVVEEIGVRVKAGRFLGAVEHTYFQKGKRHCEVNLVFEVRTPRLKPGRGPSSREDWISFSWLPMRGLLKSDLEPAPLRKVLCSWLKAPRGTDRWAGTIQRTS